MNDSSRSCFGPNLDEHTLVSFEWRLFVRSVAELLNHSEIMFSIKYKDEQA